MWDSYIYTFAETPDQLPHELQDENLGLIPWFRPLMWLTTLSVVLSDTMVACNFKSAMKQVGFRFATQSGAQDFLYLVVSSFLGWIGKYEYFFKNPLYDVIEPMFTATPSGHKVTCLQIGYQLGQLPDVLFNFETPTDVFYENVENYDRNY